MDQRKDPRVEVSQPVLFFIDIYSRPRVGSIRDLSLGGTRIETGYGFIPGERLEVTIPIRPQAITCRGRAVYVSNPREGRREAGIQFENLSEYDRLYLKQYISQVQEGRA